MSRKLFYIIVVLLVAGCQQIETHKSLGTEQIKYIRSLGILDENERIIKFYSEHTKKHAGNFYTNKRVAKYWIDENKPTKNEVNSAFFNDILKIDTVFNAGLTYCPYMKIHTNTGGTFNVCVDGTKEDVKTFFEDVLRIWATKQ